MTGEETRVTRRPPETCLGRQDLRRTRFVSREPVKGVKDLSPGGPLRPHPYRRTRVLRRVYFRGQPSRKILRGPTKVGPQNVSFSFLLDPSKFPTVPVKELVDTGDSRNKRYFFVSPKKPKRNHCCLSILNNSRTSNGSRKCVS